MGDMNNEQLMELFPCRIRRKFSRGLKRKPMALIKKLRKKKKECAPNEKPDVVKTHLRDMVIVPEMTGSVVGVYNGKTFTQVEIKPEMIGHYLGEFSITYKPVKHGRPGIGATHSSRFIPLKYRIFFAFLRYHHYDVIKSEKNPNPLKKKKKKKKKPHPLKKKKKKKKK